MKTTFKKIEKLTSKKAFNELIKLGRSFYSHPFLIIWKKTTPEEKYPAQVAVSVSKKLFKRAVDRNTIKRRTLEAYRLNKHELYKFLESKNFGLVLIIIYREKQIIDYNSIEKGIISAFQYFIKNL
ncbi:MAG: ribonuclease P protein component [Bacteroidetes bacterium]|nr:ribonuclease P protein component [Bacteroidota bacterium]